MQDKITLFETIPKKQIEKLVEECGFVKITGRGCQGRTTYWTVPQLADCGDKWNYVICVADRFMYINTKLEYGNTEDEWDWDPKQHCHKKTGTHKVKPYFRFSYSDKLPMTFFNEGVIRSLAKEVSKNIMKAKIDMVRQDEDEIKE